MPTNTRAILDRSQATAFICLVVSTCGFFFLSMNILAGGCGSSGVVRMTGREVSMALC